jgi:hypothetical protein
MRHLVRGGIEFGPAGAAFDEAPQHREAFDGAGIFQQVFDAHRAGQAEGQPL